LDQLLSPDTKLIVELGSWLGSSTKRLLAGAPNAVVIAVDFWSNRFVLEQQGDHYVKDPLQARMLERLSLLDTFVANTWSFGDRLILMRMSTPRAMRLIRDALLQAEESAASASPRSNRRPLLQPDLVYVDADHHHAAAKRDIEAALAFFPDAHIVGDDWDYSGVRRAATELAAAYGRRVHAQDGKCWTYSQCKPPSSAAQDLHADALGGTLGAISGAEALAEARPSPEFAADAERTGSVVAWADVAAGRCPGARGWSKQATRSTEASPAVVASADQDDDDDDVAAADDGGVVIVAATAEEDDRSKRVREPETEAAQSAAGAAASEEGGADSSAKRAKAGSAASETPDGAIVVEAEPVTAPSISASDSASASASASASDSALSFRLTSLDRLEQLAYPSRPAKASVVAWIGSAGGGASSGVRRAKEAALPPALQAAVDAVRVDDAAGLSAALAMSSWSPRMLSTVVSKAKLTILHFAARAAAVECVRVLVGAGADVNRALAKSRMTPLHEACYTGSAEAARLLLELGADPKARSKWGETPAQAAGKGLDVDGDCESLVAAAAAAAAADSGKHAGGAASSPSRGRLAGGGPSYDASKGGYARAPRETSKPAPSHAGSSRGRSGGRGGGEASAARSEDEGAGRSSRRSVSSSVSEDLFADSGRAGTARRGGSRSKSDRRGTRRSSSRRHRHSDGSSDDDGDEDGGGSRRRHRRHRDDDRSRRRTSSSSRHHRHRHRSTSRSHRDEDDDERRRSSSSRRHHRSHGHRKDRTSRSPRRDSSRSRSR
jgi:hypothetical protein